MRYRIQAFLFVLVAVMLGCNEYMVVGVLTEIHNDLGTPLSLLGILVTVFALTYALTTPLIALAAGRFAKHKLLFTLVTIFLIGNTWTAFSTNFISLLLSRMLTAMTAGSIISTTLMMANHIAPKEERASLLAKVLSGFNLASLFGVPLGTYLSTHISWHLSFIAVTLLTVLVLLGLVIYAPRDMQPVTTTDEHAGGSVWAFLCDRRILWTVAFIMTLCGAQFSYYTYIRPILTNELGFTNAWLNILLFVLGLAAFLGTRFGGVVAERKAGVQNVAWLYLAMCLMLVAIEGLLHTSQWISFGLIAVVCLLASSYGATVQVMFLDIAASDYPQAIDLASSMNPVFSNYGISLGSFAAAEYLSVNYHVSHVVILAAIFSLLAFGCALGMKRALKKKPLQPVLDEE